MANTQSEQRRITRPSTKKSLSMSEICTVARTLATVNRERLHESNGADQA